MIRDISDPPPLFVYEWDARAHGATFIVVDYTEEGARAKILGEHKFVSSWLASDLSAAPNNRYPFFPGVVVEIENGE